MATVFGPMIYDVSTFIIIAYIIIFSVLALYLPFARYASVFSVMTKKTISDHGIWRKIHIYYGITLIPFIIILILALFLQNIFIKHLIHIVVIILVGVCWKLIEVFTERKKYQEIVKRRKEKLDCQKELLKGFIYDED